MSLVVLATNELWLLLIPSRDHDIELTGINNGDLPAWSAKITSATNHLVTKLVNPMSRPQMQHIPESF